MIFKLLSLILPALLVLVPIITSAAPIQNFPKSTKGTNPSTQVDTASLTFPSLESLVETALMNLNAKDTAALLRMAFNKPEFLKAYPLFEADTSRSRRDFACNYYLADNSKILIRILEREGGKSLEVARIEVQGTKGEGKEFELSRGLKIWVRQGEKEILLRFIKSAAKTANGWKIWSFQDD